MRIPTKLLLLEVLLWLLQSFNPVRGGCTLPSLNASYDTSGCAGNIAASACNLRCAVNWAGAPNVSCPGSGSFAVSGICTVASLFEVGLNPGYGYRGGHALLVFNNQLYVIGGCNAQSNAVKDIYTSYDGTVWTLLIQTTANVTAVSDMYADVLGTSIVITGGSKYAGSTTLSTINQRSDDGGKSWTTAPVTFSGRYKHAGAVLNGVMFVIAGQTSTSSRVNDVWKSSNGTNWVQVTTTTPIFTTRSSHAVVAYNGALFLFGGTASTGMVGDLWKSPTGATWTSITVTTSSIGPARSGLRFALFSGRLYLFGGAFVSMEAQLPLVYSSIDGSTWVQGKNVTMPQSLFGSATYNDSVYFTSQVSPYRIYRFSATCNGLTNCPSNYVLKSNASCQAAICTTADCCFPLCSGYTCPASNPERKYPKSGSIVCPSSGCSDDICCEGASCTLSSLNTTTFDNTACVGNLTAAACNLRCAVNYGGAVNATCATPGTFDVSGGCTVASWFLVRSSPPYGVRNRHGLLVFNNQLYLIGGAINSASSPTNDIFTSYDGSVWTLLIQTTNFTSAMLFYADVLGTSIVITGGKFANSSVSTINQKSDDGGKSWTTAPVTFPGRFSHAGAVLNGVMFVISGSSGSSDVWSSSNGTNWVEVTTTTPIFTGRYDHAVVAYNGELYLFGGTTTAGVEKDLWKSPTGATWTNISTSLGPGRAATRFALFSGRLYLFGGVGQGSAILNLVYSSIDGRTWVQGRNMSIGSTSYYGCTNYNGSVYVTTTTSPFSIYRLGTTCNGFSCPANTFCNSSASCQAVPCTATECCTPLCAGYTCPSDNPQRMYPKDGGIMCTGGSCTSDICCEGPRCTLPTLDASYDTSACVGNITIEGCALGCAPDYWSSLNVSCNTPGTFAVDGGCAVASWFTILPSSGLPYIKREGAALLVVNNQLYLMGGMINNVPFAEIFTSYDGVTWGFLMQTVPFSARVNFYAAVVGSQIIITGGTADGFQASNLVQISNDNGQSWTSFTAAFPARFFHSGVVWNGEMFVVAGKSPSTINSVWNKAVLKEKGRGVVGGWVDRKSVSPTEAKMTPQSH